MLFQKSNIAYSILILLSCFPSFASRGHTSGQISNLAVIKQAEAPEEEMRKYPEEYGYYKAMKLDNAVSDFNSRASKDSIGKNQPLLTVQEVLTAIRSWNIELEPIDRKIFNEYQKISTTGLLPKGSYIDFNKGFFSNNGYDGDAWVITMEVGLNRNYGIDDEDRPHFRRLIRLQYLTSTPTQPKRIKDPSP